MNKVAVMQPYIFPYIGYFQLIDAVDHFVFYDDVDYIKGGWVNRNRILINKKENLFTIPLNKASSFKHINEIELHPILYPKWVKKFLKSIEQAYKKSPNYEKVFPLIRNILSSKHDTISSLAIHSITSLLDYLDYDRKIYRSSVHFSETKNLGRADRLVEICKMLDSNQYINVSGGRDLYDKEYFKGRKIDLYFLDHGLSKYDQQIEGFVSGLSIIDILMHNSVLETKKLINNYNLN